MVAGCGDDDEDAGDATTTTAAADEETTTTAADEGGEDGGDNAELCALAEELFNQEEFPSAEQIQQYQELRPRSSPRPPRSPARPSSSSQDDPVALFAALAEDDVEAATVEINTFESENCGIETTTRSWPSAPTSPRRAQPRSMSSPASTRSPSPRGSPLAAPRSC